MSNLFSHRTPYNLLLVLGFHVDQVIPGFICHSSSSQEKPPFFCRSKEITEDPVVLHEDFLCSPFIDQTHNFRNILVKQVVIKRLAAYGIFRVRKGAASPA
ncbi:hypothetical protein ACHAXN_000232 [Cyclotella atomus]